MLVSANKPDNHDNYFIYKNENKEHNFLNGVKDFTEVPETLSDVNSKLEKEKHEYGYSINNENLDKLRDYILYSSQEKNKICKIGKTKYCNSKNYNESICFNKKNFLRQIEKCNYIISDLNLDFKKLDNYVAEGILEDYIKDKSLSYMNLHGHLSFFCSLQKGWTNFDSSKAKSIINWLGCDRAVQIKKLELEFLEISLKDLNVICPNLDELHLRCPSSFNPLSNDISKDFKNISLFPSLKKIKLFSFDLKSLSFLLGKLRKLKLHENLELNLSFNPFDVDEWSRQMCIESFKELQTIENITKLTIDTGATEDKFAKSVIDEACKAIITKFSKLVELNIYNNDVENIKKTGKFECLKKLNLTHNSCNLNTDQVAKDIRDILPKLESFFLDGKEMVPQATLAELYDTVNVNSNFPDSHSAAKTIESIQNIFISLFNGKLPLNPEVVKSYINLVTQTIKNQAIRFNPESFYLTPPARVKQFAGVCLAGLGLYYFMRPQTVQVVTSSLPTQAPATSSLSILSPYLPPYENFPSYEKIGMITAGAFLALATIYKFSNKQNSKLQKKTTPEVGLGVSSIKNKINSMLGIST